MASNSSSVKCALLVADGRPEETHQRKVASSASVTQHVGSCPVSRGMLVSREVKLLPKKHDIMLQVLVYLAMTIEGITRLEAECMLYEFSTAHAFPGLSRNRSDMPQDG